MNQTESPLSRTSVNKDKGLKHHDFSQEQVRGTLSALTKQRRTQWLQKNKNKNRRMTHVLLDPLYKFPYAFWWAKIYTKLEPSESLASNRHGAPRGFYAVFQMQKESSEHAEWKAAGFAPRLIHGKSPIFITWEMRSSVLMKTRYSEFRLILGAFKTRLCVQGHYVLWDFFLTTLVFCKKDIFSVFEERHYIIWILTTGFYAATYGSKACRLCLMLCTDALCQH